MITSVWGMLKRKVLLPIQHKSGALVKISESTGSNLAGNESVADFVF
jgi:hypothetical protein